MQRGVRRHNRRTTEARLELLLLLLQLLLLCRQQVPFSVIIEYAVYMYDG